MSARYMEALLDHAEWTTPRLDWKPAYEAWSSAYEQAKGAFADWCTSRTPEAYAVYRAAQDREDAAQDALARHAA
jgi:hypothetical protein